MTVELCQLCKELHDVETVTMDGVTYSSCIHLEGPVVVDMSAVQRLSAPVQVAAPGRWGKQQQG